VTDVGGEVGDCDAEVGEELVEEEPVVAHVHKRALVGEFELLRDAVLRGSAG
jgi:hypothetical protein